MLTLSYKVIFFSAVEQSNALADIPRTHLKTRTTLQKTVVRGRRKKNSW